MRTHIRIVAGTLRGRKLVCDVNPQLRPTPQTVREALFSLLGNAVPERPFYDVFAGTGVVGMEAISRGASYTTFVERDFRLIGDLERHLKEFGVADRARPVRADVYRWAERWQAPTEPVTVFLSPPFADLKRRLDEQMQLVTEIMTKIADGSVVVLQGEQGVSWEKLPRRPEWEERRYGRNLLLVWVKDLGEQPESPPVKAADDGA